MNRNLTAHGRFGNRLIWALIFPRQRRRTFPTLSGVLLIGLSLGIGMAAYNAGNNILFMTLALMLACLVLSGLLSWLNFRGVSWQLDVAAPVRAGQEAVVALAVRNRKKLLPGYGLWFDLTARTVERDAPAKPESTFTARGAEIRAALAKAEASQAKTRLFLRARLDPRGEVRLEWIFAPEHRGRLRIAMESVGSLFPFGFLQKSLATDLAREIVVWPTPVAYRSFPLRAARHPAGGERVARVGAGSDLLALRRYELGDSHRLIHWKASARSRRLLVRQFAAESAEGFSLWLETDATRWPRAEQFELAVSFAATLAEDLFRRGKLVTAALGRESPAAMRRVADLEAFLDRLAVVPGVTAGGDETEVAGGVARPPGEGVRRRNLITFAPEGPRGVIAMVEGRPFAAV